MINLSPNLKLFLYISGAVLGTAFVLNAVGAAPTVVTGVAGLAGLGMYLLRSKLG